MTFDEGGLRTQITYGSRLALPSTGEEGYADIFTKWKTEGGYTSAPLKIYSYLYDQSLWSPSLKLINLI